MTPQQPPQGMPPWLKAILIVIGILIGLVVLLFGICVVLINLGQV